MPMTELCFCGSASQKVAKLRNVGDRMGSKVAEDRD
jgi:hypothetical protein